MNDTKEETAEITRNRAVVKTSVQLNEFERIWIIENFRLRKNYRWQYWNNKMFTFHNNEEKYELFLTVLSNDYVDYNDDNFDWDDEMDPRNLELTLERFSSPTYVKRAKVQLSFIFKNELIKVVDKWTVIDPDKKNIVEGALNWYNIEVGRYFSASNDLTIQLLIKFDNGDLHHEDYSDLTLNTREKSVINDLKSLLTSSQFSDFKIIVADKEFPVHRNIVAARSTFFRNMFESGMRENAEDTVEFNDIDPETMGEMLHYIYTGSFERIESLMKVDLLRATDKYELDDLNLLCVRALTKNLSVAGLPDVLKLVDKLEHCRNLRDSVLRFVTSNGKEITNMENLSDLMQSLSPTLLTQVIKALAQSA